MCQETVAGSSRFPGQSEMSTRSRTTSVIGRSWPFVGVREIASTTS